MSRESSPEFILGYGEAQARARAGGQIMGTEIEGHGRLARMQELVERRQKGTQQEVQFLILFNELREHFAAADEVHLKDKFLGLPNAAYKNPAAFLLAEIVLQQGLTRESLRDARTLAGQIDQGGVVEEDILRYCRLLQKV